ncbi:MAG TPA: divalent-cation tolerance protein CutA [Candidatus Omnitrophota bacterium]|nr:divalent-cation tolerance protein CutA [Candidatus Omnitrophota bacterium]
MYIVVLVTAKDKRQAKAIAKKLLKEKLIACANIVENVQSLFWWDGKIDGSKEALLLLKTKRGLFGKLAKAVKALHTYDVPEIIALPIIKGYNPYLRWIGKSTKDK